MFWKGRPRNKAKGEVAVCGICGSYSDHLSLLIKDGLIKFPLVHAPQQWIVVLCLIGSSATNSSLREDAEFLRNLAADVVLTSEDTLLVGLDRHRNVEKAKTAFPEFLSIS